VSDADRWGRIEALFAELSEAPESRRHAVLSSVDDPEVSAEVGKLLRAHDQLTGGDGGFLEHLDAHRAHDLVGGETTPPGMTIGRYPVVRPLGRGGMGIVYLARDPRLDRHVAIKLLPHYLSGDPTAVSRLAAEARTASALDHPNIATVHEIAETDDGQAFIVMAYYDGETLRERLSHGPLYLDEAVDVGTQLADGLSAAHRAGIIHRDIKPENVILTRDGVLKILDFGIAKAATADLATGGLMRGTAAYVSPEQSRGESVDQRTDIWSAGVVLHELLTGSRPFSGEGEALIDAIRRNPPAPLAPTRSGVPPALTTLIARCLAKDPEDRVGSAAELGAEIRAIRDGRVTSPGGRTRPVRWIAAAVAAAAVTAALLLTRGQSNRPEPSQSASTAPAVAVLPFEVRGEDLEVWREGMVDVLTANLDGVAGLRAIDSRTVLVRWQRETGGEDTLDLGRAIAVARETGAGYAVLGSVVPGGPGLRVSARVHSVSDGALLASFQVDGTVDSILSLIDRLSIDVLATIWEGREQAPGLGLARITTTSLPALKAYLNGERHLRRADWPGAIASYEQAIASDSTFAFASYHLGLAYMWLGEPAEGGQRSIEALSRSLRHSDRLPDRERLLLRTAYAVHVPTGHDLSETLRLAQRATLLYPDDAEAWYLLGEIYFHAGDQLLLDWEEGERAFRRSIELDPGFTVPYPHLIQNEFNRGGDSARTAGLIEAFRALAPDSRFVQEFDLAFGLAFGDSSRRSATLSSLQSVSTEVFNGATWVGLTHPRYWRVVLTALERRPRQATAAGRTLTSRLFNLALMTGDLEAALRYLFDPLLFEGMRFGGVYRMKLAGIAIPDTVLQTVLAMPATTSAPDSTTSPSQLFFAGAHAAEEGRWTDLAVAAARLREIADTLRSLGDSANARFAGGAATSLEGYGASRRGDPGRGLALLSRGHLETAWFESLTRNTLNDVVRLWIGEVLLTRNQPVESARYFASLTWDPLAAERLAPIYEQLGDVKRARDAYALVDFVWRDAHPVFRARADRARAAAKRLAPDSQGGVTPNTGVSPLGTAAGTDTSEGLRADPGSVSAFRNSTTASISSFERPSGVATRGSRAASAAL